ncbi:filamentous hemagglutinin N-terminal domain-containing protein, partial [Salmonella enterica subsp. enterica serovar Corvallis]|nr:filamentous hemagglutinin N-terminal domain-containing protein [Salmonella enterica subsp. enterica serovar Corvallis]
MNKIYKLKYDRRRQQLVAVSELTTGAGKEATGQVCGLSDISSFRKLLGTLTPLAFLTGLIVSLLPGMALANPSLPTGGQIVAGQGSISTSGNQMTVNQNTQGMVTNWNSFDIGKNHTVQFVQPGSSAVALNRVTGGHESQILGTLKANGQVMLINPAGVMFGKGAKVNTAGLVASTKNISNEDFMAGRYTFSGGSQPGAEIVNQGSLTTTKGGYIVLAADRVRNQGEIRTPGGRVVLAAADRVTLQLDNTGLTAVSVNGSVVNALAENRGLISATNGQVYLTARGKDMLLNTVVNNSGTVEAKGLSERGGEIVLDGGDSGVVSQSGMLLADSDSGRGGKITLEGQNIHLAGGSLISATGETGGGEVYVGGGWQGKDSSIRHASKVVMDKTAVIDVSAKARGQGGTAVLWSDDYTNFRGTILARGGLQGGDGGRVETSSHNNLQAFGDVDASAVKGNAGEWLLDPFDITVVSGSTDNDVNEGSGNDGIFTPDSGTSQVSNGTINNRLNSGTNVTIKTAKENSGSNQWGNITVNASIEHTAGNNVSLTLEADGNINITNHSITSTTGKLDVNLLGAGSHDGTITLNNATVSSNGGNITLGQLNAGSDGTTSGLAVSITNSTLNATSAGNISITANNGTTLGNGTLSGNEVSVSASSGTGDALAINNGSKLTAAGNLTVSGETSATGNKYGIHTWGNSQFTAGDTLNMTAEAAGGTDGAFNASNINVSAQNAVIKGTSGGANGTGVKMDGNVTNTMNGGNLTITGTTTGSGAGSIGVNVLANLSTNGTGNLNITGKGAQGIGVNLTNKTLSGGNVTVTGTSGNSNGKGLDVSGTTLNATNGNIVLTGCMTGRNGGFGAHIHGGSSFKATENITITGYAMDGTNGGLNLNGGTFNATSTVLNGTSQNNNLGAKVGGVITVSQGNLSLSGTANRVNSAPNVTGVLSDGTLSITVSSGTLNVSGKVNDTANNPTNAGTTRGLSLVNTTLNATEVSLSGEVAGGRGGTGASLTNTTINATTGNATLNATVANGNALAVSGGNISAGKDISLTGTAKTGSGYGVSLTNGNMTASSGNISVNGTGQDTAQGALNVSGGNFSAQNTMLEGTASRNNVGAKLAGNINVTQGNLSINGTANRVNSASGVTGVVSGDTLNITVSSGALNVSGKVNDTGNNATNASTATGLNLVNATLNATTANLSGISTNAGTGFTLNNVTLAGGIEKGANVSFSSAGSGKPVTNVIGSGVLNATTTEALMLAGIENTTQISASGMVLGGSGDDWNQNYTSTKGGGWIFDGATVSKTGNISLQGVGFVNSSVTAGQDLTVNNGDASLTVQNTTLNATAGNISLTGNAGISLSGSNMTAGKDLTINNGDASLTVQNTTLNATAGNISLTGNAGISLSESNMTAGKDLTINSDAGSLSLTNSDLNATAGNIGLNATVANGNALTVSGGNISAGKDISLTGTAKTGSGYGVSLTNGNMTASSGNISVNGTGYDSGSGALQVNGGNFSALNTVLEGTAGRNNVGANLTGNINVTQGNLAVTGTVKRTNDGAYQGLTASNLNISVTGGTLNLAGCITNAAASGSKPVALTLTNANLSATDVSLSGTVESGGTGLSLTNTTINATTGNATLNATVANGNALAVSGGNISAGKDISLTGTAKTGSGYGVSLTNGNMTASSGNISVNGTGYDSGSGALNVNGGNFSAQNTVLEGTAGRNNVGAKLAGNINVTQGNLSVTGTTHHLTNGSYTGLLAGSGLNVNVSQGNLSLAGQALKKDGNDVSGNTVGLNLTNAILSAEHASLKGSSTSSGSGFILNNVTLEGGIARGENMTVSSAGSAASITNTLNINGGLGYGAFESMKQAGIDNKTTVGSLTASQDELKQYMNFSESSDWSFNGASLGGDNWTIAALTGINATTTGNITLTGMGLTNSNLTGSSVSLNGDGNASLTVTNTTLNATSGNVSLNTSNGTLTVRNVNLSSAGGESTLSGTSLENGTGVKLAGNINVTQGNLTVNGTVNRTGETNVWGIDARDATINVSASGAVLNMTGKVASDSGNGSVSVVGLDLSGNSVLNAHTANLIGTSVTNGYGFLLNSELQGGLTTNGSLTLSSKGSGDGVSNQIGYRVSADVVKHMIEQNVSIGSYTDTTITNLYKQADFTQWITEGNGNLNKNFGDFGLKFSGINITAGNISLTGTSFNNSNLTATSGDLTIDNKGGALGLSNTALNASSGNISLTGGSISLTGGQDVTAGKDIMLNASKGGVNITGQNGSNLKDITSGSGNISINGYSVGAGDSGTDDYKTSGVTLNNASLTASAGKINVSGVSDASYGYVSHNALFTSAGGILLLGNVSLNSTHNTLDGRDVRQGNRYTQLEQQGGIVINPGTFNFIGDTDINAHSESGAGLLANVIGSDATLNFQNGNATINAKTNATLSGSSVIAGISFTSWVYKGSLKFNVDNASLAINAEGNNVNGISPGYSYNNTYKFSGNGNVSVHGSSQTGTGISIRQMNNSGLNGSLTIAGESQSGTGVSLAGGVSLTNATVSGNSQSGTGLQISGSNISDSTLSGNASG